MTAPRPQPRCPAHVWLAALVGFVWGGYVLLTRAQGHEVGLDVLGAGPAGIVAVLTVFRRRDREGDDDGDR